MMTTETKDKPLAGWALTMYGIVPQRMIDTVEEAYGSGQPYMDNLVALLLERGARTPEEKLQTKRAAMLEEIWSSRMLTDKQRREYWDEFEVPWYTRLVYRWRVWRLGERVR